MCAGWKFIEKDPGSLFSRVTCRKQISILRFSQKLQLLFLYKSTFQRLKGNRSQWYSTRATRTFLISLFFIWRRNKSYDKFNRWFNYDYSTIVQQESITLESLQFDEIHSKKFHRSFLLFSFLMAEKTRSCAMKDLFIAERALLGKSRTRRLSSKGKKNENCFYLITASHRQVGRIERVYSKARTCTRSLPARNIKKLFHFALVFESIIDIKKNYELAEFFFLCCCHTTRRGLAWEMPENFFWWGENEKSISWLFSFSFWLFTMARPLIGSPIHSRGISARWCLLLCLLPIKQHWIEGERREWMNEWSRKKARKV